MRLTVINQLTKLQGKLLGYVGVLSYQFCQLCVKAEGASLLPIEVQMGGSDLKIEDMADVYLYEDDPEKKYEIDLVPKYGEYLQLIVQGLFENHPEFHIEIKKQNEDIDDEEDTPENKYVHVTMPEVDDNRRDILNQAIDLLYNKCKVDMEACMAKCTAEITKLTISDDPSALDEAKAKLEEQKEQYEGLREKLTEDKKKEVEDAYQRYLANHPSEEDIKKGKGNDGKTSTADETPKEKEKTPAPKEQKQDAPEEKPEQTKTPFEGIGQSLSME